MGNTDAHSLQQALRTRLQNLRTEAISLAGTAAKIAEAIDELLDRGGTLSVDKQVIFITGAHARMMKDLGVVALLQSLGISVRRPPQTR